MSLSCKPRNIESAGRLERLRLILEASDPGWLRLTQSVKTVVAVLLTMGIIYSLAPGDLFIGSVGAGFLMQCGEGVSRRRQQITLVTCGLAFIALAALGAAAGSHRELKEILVIVVAFFTFYLRRFIPRRPGFTAYGFVLFLLSTVFPGGRDQALSHVEVLAIAFIVTYTVFFFVRPPEPLRAFAIGTRLFCSSVADLLHTLSLASPGERADRCEHLVKRALRFNQALADNFLPGSESFWTDELLAEQYEAWQLLQMLQDSLTHLRPEDELLRPAVWSALRAGLDSLAEKYADLGVTQSQSPPPGSGLMQPFQAALLATGADADLSWAYFGSVLMAASRMENQTARLAGILREAEEGRQP
ncbi:hypothetical protein BH10PLA2_BH10PLA2_11630 [soil metagenome]